uniref:Uncharacterized protein n=1 Tax=Avena sativa TaxID=4498 RepID=A0ACD5WLK0_AVESA
MKITAILVLRTPEAASSSAGEEQQQQAVVLANASDMSRFRFFQRPAARDTIVLVARTIALRTAASRRHLTVQQGHEGHPVAIWPDASPADSSPPAAGYKVHCYNQNGLCAVVFTDEHYPDRSAHSILIEVLEEYQKNFGGSWRTAKEDATQTWEYLDHALTKYQDPAEADKIILNKIAQNMLQIGEPLDSLAEKCSELSAAAQMFYKPVKKTNSYCTISRGDTLMAIGAMALAAGLVLTYILGKKC